MLYFIPTPIGNLADISLRSLEVLRRCDTLFCEDTRRTKQLISLLNERFLAGINPKNFIPLHSHNESKVLANIDKAIFNSDVAYLSDAGMPGISDPGVELVRFASKQGIEFEVLAGANAALVALVSSGLCDKEFVFLGFLPNTGKERSQAIFNALNLSYPAVIYESPKRIIALISELARLAPNRQIYAAKELSKKFQRHFCAKASELVDMIRQANIDGEWVVVLDKSEVCSLERISYDDIASLSLPPKQKAKLLAKITGKSVKEIYESLASTN